MNTQQALQQIESQDQRNRRIKKECGATYQRIADEFGFSIAAIWKWVKAWEAKGTI